MCETLLIHSHHLGLRTGSVTSFYSDSIVFFEEYFCLMSLLRSTAPLTNHLLQIAPVVRACRVPLSTVHECTVIQCLYTFSVG